jgi:hypothetical protein
LDVVAGVALREFVISLRKQYGLDPMDSVGDAIGTEIAWVSFGGDQSRAMLIRVNDKSRLSPAVTRYLSRKGASIAREQYHGTEIQNSSSDDRRAAAFVGDFLALGTIDQIKSMVDTASGPDGINRDERLNQMLATRPANSSVISYRPQVGGAGKLLLAISQVARATDGSPELLDGDKARKALSRLPTATSATEFRDYGIYTETHSAVGNLSLLSGN